MHDPHSFSFSLLSFQSIVAAPLPVCCDSPQRDTKEASAPRESYDSAIKTYARCSIEDNRVQEMCRNGKESENEKRYPPTLFAKIKYIQYVLDCQVILARIFN